MPRANSASVRQQFMNTPVHTQILHYPLPLREIGAAVNLASPSTVHMHLRSWSSLALIETPKKPRTMKIVPQASTLLTQQSLLRYSRRS